jgi:hypothetical protein
VELEPTLMNKAPKIRMRKKPVSYLVVKYEIRQSSIQPGLPGSGETNEN